MWKCQCQRQSTSTTNRMLCTSDQSLCHTSTVTRCTCCNLALHSKQINQLFKTIFTKIYRMPYMLLSWNLQIYLCTTFAGITLENPCAVMHEATTLRASIQGWYMNMTACEGLEGAPEVEQTLENRCSCQDKAWERYSCKQAQHCKLCVWESNTYGQLLGAALAVGKVCKGCAFSKKHHTYW